MRVLPAIKDWVRNYTSRIVWWSLMARSSETNYEQVEGYETDPTDPQYQLPARRFQHYGFRSRPGAGTEMITVAPGGGSSNRVSIASEAPGTGPTDQEEWEAEFYSKNGQRVRLQTDGTVTIDAASGKDVIVNGGSAAVARVGDEVDSGFFTVTVTQSAPPGMPDGTIDISYTDQLGIITLFFSVTIPGLSGSGTPGGTLNLKGKIVAGAPHFKGQ